MIKSKNYYKLDLRMCKNCLIIALILVCICFLANEVFSCSCTMKREKSRVYQPSVFIPGAYVKVTITYENYKVISSNPEVIYVCSTFTQTQKRIATITDVGAAIGSFSPSPAPDYEDDTCPL